MRVGVFARTFARPSLGAALDAVVAAGIDAIQFNLALTGGPSLPPAVPPELAGTVRAALAARRLDMVAVSGTYNMAHPDPAARRDGARRLDALVAAAPALGTRVVTLGAGSRDRDDLWRAHPDNGTPAAWRDSRAQIAHALAGAERHRVVLAVEPEAGTVVADAAAARRLLDELRSPHLGVVLDAANLVAPGGLGDQGDVLREAVDLVGEDVVLAHAKDVSADGTIVAAGRGGLDHGRWIGLLRDAGYDGALVLHGLAEHEVPAAVRLLRRHLGPGGAP